MRFALDLHDSEVRDVAMHGSEVRIRFAAASVRDLRGVRGWLQGVTLVMAEARLAGDTAHAFGRLAEGQLSQDGRAIVRPALPATLAGELALTLRFANGTRLGAHGSSLALGLADDFKFTEDLSC